MGWKTNVAALTLATSFGWIMGTTYRIQSPITHLDISVWPPAIEYELQDILTERDHSTETVDGLRVAYEDRGKLGLDGPYLSSDMCTYKLPPRQPNGCFVPGNPLEEFYLGNKNDRAILKGEPLEPTQPPKRNVPVSKLEENIKKLQESH